MKTAVLLVKNGIGFGHIRRAILIAEAIQEAGQVRPVVVSQATSLSLFRDTTVEVVNFPLLHRVSAAVAEDSYTAILNRLLDCLDPAVVIEDTYPDPRYLSLDALAGRPRLLVMRRLDGASFDQLRTQGRFGAYDEILVAQSPEGFSHEGHSGDSATAVEQSGRFSFVGNLCYTPTLAEIEQTAADFAPDGQPLVVVSAGAGGDQMADGYGDRLFSACAFVAEKLRSEGHRAQFVLVTGPYYAGKPVPQTPNVAVRRFEPRLAALLAGAHVAVIKPGNNSLSEALLGRAQLILVPDVSFMEGLDEHAAKVVARYGGATASTDPVVLEAEIRAALARLQRQECVAPNHDGLAAVVKTVHNLAQPSAVDVPKRQLLLVLAATASTRTAGRRSWLPPSLGRATVLDGESSGCGSLWQWGPESGGSAHAMLLGGDVPVDVPQSLVDRGVRLVITPGAGVAAAVERWCRLAPAMPSLRVIESMKITARIGSERAFFRRAAQLLSQVGPACVVLDLAQLSCDETRDYLSVIGEWLASQPVELISPEAMTAQAARQLLEPA